MNRLAWLVSLALLVAGGAAARQASSQPPPEVQALHTLTESFSGQALDSSVWVVTRKNDFQETKVDVARGRLRLRAATIGTDDRTVKFQGVRTVAPLLLRDPLELSFTLDWNKQANGCYLTAGIFLCPAATSGNPADEKSWWNFEYVGVPPGKNARAWVQVCKRGGRRVLYDEGWPTKQRTGRRIGVQKVTLRWRNGVLTLEENGKRLWKTNWEGFGFRSAYLYLQMSTHSNYPAREVFFDDVSFHAGGN